MKDKILVYGADGYMGQLFTQFALEAQLPIVLAGRGAFKTDIPYRQFTLDTNEGILPNLRDIKLLVNLAGPFLNTQSKLIEACIQTQTHYIDISGEANDIARVVGYHEAALKALVMLLPGAGFGVVPTDVAAKLVQQKLKDANQLIIAYVTQGGASRGTLKTVLMDIHKEGIERVNDKLKPAKPAKEDFYFEHQNKRFRVVYNPWRADLITAAYSTAIPSVKTFSNFPSLVEAMMHGKYLWLRDFILQYILRWLPAGPSKKALQKGKTIIFAQVKNSMGQTAQIKIIGPEAYQFTAQTLIAICCKILNNDFEPGFKTPSIYGREIIEKPFQNVHIID